MWFLSPFRSIVKMKITEREGADGARCEFRHSPVTTMIEGSLNTTNVLVGIMAVVSLLQALVLIGVCVLALRLYRQTLKTITDIEERQVAPLTAAVVGLVDTVDGILADVKDVTTRVARQTERVDEAVDNTMDAAENTARRAFGSAAPRVLRIAELAFGVTCALQDLFKGRRRGARSTKESGGTKDVRR